VHILGNDKGTQYASVIYCYDSRQLEIAKRVSQELQELLNKGVVTNFLGKSVSTDIRIATEFFPAKDEHQEYLSKNPNGYCNHRIRLQQWPK